jgi:hypothetical protein
LGQKIKIKTGKGKLGWQEQLLVISQKRLFIVMDKPGTDSLEILQEVAA